VTAEKDGSFPGRQRSVVGFAAGSRMMTTFLLTTTLAVYVGRLGSPFEVSMVQTVNFVGMLLLAPVWGAIADITGRRRAVLLGSGLLASAAGLPLLVVESVWGMIGIRGLYAAFVAGFVPVMLAVASAHGGATGRGRSIGFFNSAYAVGFTCGQLGAGFLLGLLFPEQLFAVVAAFSLLSTVVVLFLSDPAPQPERRPTAGELLAEIRSRLLPAVEDRAHLRRNGLRWLYVALALRNMTVLGVGSLLPPYLIDTVGVSAFVMGAILAFNPASQTVCMYIFGRIADLMGRKPLIVVGMAGSGLHAMLAAASILPDTIGVRGVVAGVAMVMLGASYSSMATGALAFIGDVSPAVRQGELMGLRSTAKGVGGVFGTLLMGSLATMTSYATAFAAGSVLAVLAALLTALALTESKPTETDAQPTAVD